MIAFYIILVPYSSYSQIAKPVVPKFNSIYMETSVIEDY
jgi:hypothetical protein